MPPKARISKEMVIEAGLGIVRREGLENLSARSVAAALGCSTQPVMYHYTAVSELKADVYDAADELHTRYITEPYEGAGNPMLSLGLRYIRFAQEERHLFRFLFQSDSFRVRTFREMIEADDIAPVLMPLMEATGLDGEQARTVFAELFICVHGAASLLANNSIEYDEEYFARLLENTLIGAVAALKGGK